MENIVHTVVTICGEYSPYGYCHNIGMERDGEGGRGLERGGEGWKGMERDGYKENIIHIVTATP